MTDKELAEESLISYRKEPKWAGKMFMQDENTCYKDGFLAGLKAGRPEWHKVADGDLPPTSGEMHAERYPILACTKNGYVTVAIRRKHGRAYEWFCSDYDGNTLYLDKEVIAWCEIPKYTEELCLRKKLKKEQVNLKKVKL